MMATPSSASWMSFWLFLVPLQVHEFRHSPSATLNSGTLAASFNHITVWVMRVSVLLAFFHWLLLGTGAKWDAHQPTDAKGETNTPKSVAHWCPMWCVCVWSYQKLNQHTCISRTYSNIFLLHQFRPLLALGLLVGFHAGDSSGTRH